MHRIIFECCIQYIIYCVRELCNNLLAGNVSLHRNYPPGCMGTTKGAVPFSSRHSKSAIHIRGAASILRAQTWIRPLKMLVSSTLGSQSPTGLLSHSSEYSAFSHGPEYINSAQCYLRNFEYEYEHMSSVALHHPMVISRFCRSHDRDYWGPLAESMAANMSWSNLRVG